MKPAEAKPVETQPVAPSTPPTTPSQPDAVASTPIAPLVTKPEVKQPEKAATAEKASAPEANKDKVGDSYACYNACQCSDDHPFDRSRCGLLGAYGPMLHQGQARMGGSRLRPFTCVGIAYFLIAIAAPLAVISARASDTGQWSGAV